MPSSKKKRNLSVFDAIQELESQDIKAETRRKKSRTNEQHRAQAAQAQTKIYSSLVESRILLQRAVTAAEEGSDKNVISQSNILLESLLQARQRLVSGKQTSGEEYADIVKNEDSLQDVLQEEYEVVREEWKSVLNKRHNDLKLHSGLTAKSQFRIMDSSFWEQVEGTVEYEALQNKEFDDSKVYQQLLKDFVATSASSQSQKNMQRNRQQNKQKKQVDRRASKGRKIRYKEIPKLVNFTFPLSRSSQINSAGLDQDEWFQSLFGGVGKAATAS